MRSIIATIVLLVFVTLASAQTFVDTSLGPPNARMADAALDAPLPQGSVSLRDFIVSLLDDRDRAVTAALEALNKRFDGVNEFRAQLADQSKTFATRDMIDALALRLSDGAAKEDALSNRLTAIESSGPPALVARMNDLTTRLETTSNRLTTIESSGTPLSRQGQIDIQALSQRITSIEQKGAGLNEAWGFALAAFGLLFGAISTWAILRTRPRPS